MIADDEQSGAGEWRFDSLTRAGCLAVLARMFDMKTTRQTHLAQSRPGGSWELRNCLTLNGQKKAMHVFARGNGLNTELQALQYIINFYAVEFDRARAALERETKAEAAREARAEASVL